MSPTSRVLLWIAWVMEGCALYGPALSSLPDTKIAHPNLIFMLFVGLSVTFIWFVCGFAKVFFIPCGIAVCAVILRSDIKPITKIITGSVGLFACIEVVRWASTVKFS